MRHKIDQHTVNSLYYKLGMYGYYLPEQKILINNEEFVVFWTPHAQVRAEDRNGICSLVLNEFLKDILRDIYPFLKKKSGYISLRDFKLNQFTVIHIDGNKIRVITCGNVKKLYPRENDYVIQRNEDGQITDFVWQKKCKTG